MARIRTIKPEFWTDGDVMDLSPFARLLFIGSWNFAMCDFGHVADDPRRLKMQVLPGDDVDPVALVDELLASGRMRRLAVDNRTFLHIVRFTDHQKTEKRWSPRCVACQAQATSESAGQGGDEPPDEGLPPPPDDHDGPPGTSPNLSETPRTSAPEGKGGERKGREGIETAAAAARELPPAVDILRAQLDARKLIVRWDKLTDADLTEIVDFVEIHGDGPLIKAALAGYQPNNPPVFAQAWLGTWRALPVPGTGLGLVPDLPCGQPGHSGTTRHCTQCASEAKAVSS